MGTILSVLVVAVGLYFTNEANRAQQEVNRRQLDVALQGQITERFAKTIEQLGSATLDVRLGAIYALERIMRDSADDQAAVVDILAAYVRTHASRIDGGSGAAEPPPGERPHSSGPAVDVQTALAVLGRRDIRKDRKDSRLDLKRTDLAEVNLANADLTSADLTGAILDRANLQRAKLVRANLTAASLNGANLGLSNLAEADLPDAKLRESDLQGANLQHTNLRRADLSKSNLMVTELRAANISGANLAAASGVKQNQLMCTTADGTTTVPTGVVRPTGIDPGTDPSCGASPPSDSFSTGSTRILLSKPSGPTGTTVEVTGTDFDANEPVSIRFHTTTMAQAIADNAGSFRINVTIPEGFSVFAPQRFDIIATGESSVKFAYASFQLDS